MDKLSSFRSDMKPTTTTTTHQEERKLNPSARDNHFDFRTTDTDALAPRVPFSFRMPDWQSRLRLIRPVALTALVITVLPLTGHSQSLWQPGVSQSMFADKRACHVGDIITVLIEENTTASKNDETKTEKQSSLSAAISSFLYPQSAGGFLSYKGKMPAMAYNSDHKHDGTGSINDSQQVVAKIAVRIIDVLPDGNYVVEGRRETAFGGERQTVLLHGIVRAYDVQADNTIYSYNIADASIQIVGRGTITESTRKGWFDRIWDIISPF